MTASTETKENKREKLIIVGAGGEWEKSAHLAAQIAAMGKDFDVEIVSPASAKQMQLIPNDSIVPVRNLIPKMLQYYPHDQVQPNRKQRRLEAKKNRRKH